MQISLYNLFSFLIIDVIITNGYYFNCFTSIIFVWQLAAELIGKIYFFPWLAQNIKHLHIQITNYKFPFNMGKTHHLIFFNAVVVNFFKVKNKLLNFQTFLIKKIHSMLFLRLLILKQLLPSFLLYFLFFKSLLLRNCHPN